MFNFIHKRAVASYIDELKKLIEVYSILEKEQLADYFIYSVWTRAGFQNEGHFKLPDGTQNLSPNVDYSMLSPLKSAIKILKKRGNATEAMALSIWIHTARGVVNVEMENEVDKLWQLIITTKNLWDKYLTKFYNEDKNRLDPKMLNETMALSKEILRNLPPKQS